MIRFVWCVWVYSFSSALEYVARFDNDVQGHFPKLWTDGRMNVCTDWLIDWELKITSIKCYQNGHMWTFLPSWEKNIKRQYKQWWAAIQPTTNYVPHQINHWTQKDHNVLRWKSRSCLGETLKCSGVTHLLEVVFPYSLIRPLSQTAFTLHVVICKIKIKCHLHFLKNASIPLYVQLHYRIKAHVLKQRFNYTLLCIQRK